MVFWLTPHMILTGLAMSPAVESRARWYPRLFFGRQPARSLHFLGMVAYLAFLAVHLLMVVVHGPARELTKMTLGAGREGDAWLGLALGLAIIAAVVAHQRGGHARLAARAPRPSTACSRRSSTRRAVPCCTTSRPVANYPESEISPYFRVNGYPPTEEYPKARDDEYVRLQQRRLRRLAAGGLGAGRDAPAPLARRPPRDAPPGADHDAPLHPGLDGHRPLGGRLASRTSSTAAGSRRRPATWSSTPTSGTRQSGKPYYEVIDLETARQPQTILAYEMNGVPLPIPHGAPLRLRVENELGFKMVKYLRSIEAVADYRKVGDGHGGHPRGHAAIRHVGQYLRELKEGTRPQMSPMGGDRGGTSAKSAAVVLQGPADLPPLIGDICV